jgi:glycosyltransferase involved in cell wall biosynthesis
MLRAASAYWREHEIDGTILSTGADPGPYAEALAEAGYAITHRPLWKSPIYFWRLWEYLRAQQYDVIHVHCERASFYFCLTARLAGVRTIVRTIHNVFQFSGNLRRLRALQRAIVRRCCGVQMIAVSGDVRRCEQERFRNPAQVVPNWYDSNTFLPAGEASRLGLRRALGISQDCLAVVSVGNCNAVKNHAVMIEALREMDEQMAVRYLHVGAEDAQQSERQLAHRLGVAHRVEFLGSRSDVARILQAADVFVMPSKYEGVGIAAMEAMAVRLPVVLADVQGLRQLARLGPEVELVEGTPRCFAQAIVRLQAAGENERRAKGRRLSQAVRQMHRIERGASQYLNLYRRTK